ncbi:MAG TPA: TfoX/Sxy family protein [bacterium]|nr:TfoX/Sxy family protein [bacterium]
MSQLSPFVDFVINDLLAGLPALTHRRMFGAYGLYSAGRFFAIIDDGTLYLKADEALKEEFKEAGSIVFSYPMKDGEVATLNYWSLPEEALEDHELAKVWALKSIAIANPPKKR